MDVTLNFISNDPADNKSILVQIIDCRRIGDMSLLELMVA